MNPHPSISRLTLLAVGCALGLPGLFAQRATPAAGGAQLSATPLHKSGIYDLGEKAGWTLTLPAGAPAPTGNYTFTIKTNNSATVKTGEIDLSTGTATLETTFDQPAMLYVQISPPARGQGTPLAAATPGAPAEGAPAPAAVVRGGGARRGGGGRGGNGALTLGAAVAPTQLQPAVARPADFDAFWDGKLKLLAAVPINPVLTPTTTNQAGVELSTVMLDSLNSHVQGYLAKPTKEGKFPALILYQYAGVYNLQTTSVTDRAKEGWLAFDVDSHDIPPSEGQQQHPELNNYQSKGNTDKETTYFLNMYLRDARAVDYIMSRPDWDGKTIVFMGTSMGGQQSLVTAGLRPNVTALLVNVPSGADFDGDLHGRKAGYPNWSSANPQVMATGLYFDTVNFASHIKAKALIAMGFIDTTAPPVGIWTAFNQIPGAKEAVPMIESDHNNITPQKQGAWDARSKEVLNLLLKSGDFKPNAATAQP